VRRRVGEFLSNLIDVLLVALLDLFLEQVLEGALLAIARVARVESVEPIADVAATMRS